MMKNVRKIVAMVMALMMITAFATGCGSSKPTADDAKAYVQAVIDMMCTGDYDHSVKLADVEEGKETETRDALIDSALVAFDNAGLSQGVKDQFKDYIITALGKAKYTVGDAVETEDGGYDVTVTVEPLKIFADVQEEFVAKIPDSLGYDLAELSAMSEDELNDAIYTAMINFMSAKLENPQYDDPQDVTVHYGLLDEENKLYGVNESDGNKIGNLIFSNEGL